MTIGDKWLSYVAWFLFLYISFTSQVLIFWPWLFGSSSVSPYESNDPFGIEGYEDEESRAFNPFGFLSVMWANLNVQAILYLVPFNFSQAMLCWNYYLTMNTDPGSPPLHWEPPTDGSNMEYKKSTHTPRYCRTCDTFKPPRTHHCRLCKKCVLKMDHHCPWVRNCIGYFNYGHFVRFIIWTTITTFICAILLTLCCWEAYENEKLGTNLHSLPNSDQIILIIINICLDVSVLFGVSVLTVYHLWCISINTTTIESWEKDRVLTIILHGKIKDIKCPYNQGIFTNFQEVLGQNPFLWLWPQPMLGDGLSFKVRPYKAKSKSKSKRRVSEDGDSSSSSSSSTPIGTRWLRKFSSNRNRHDGPVEMV